MSKKLEKETDKKDYFLDKLTENEKRLNQLEIELKSFLKNITLTKWCVILILGLFGFFGYREITGIRGTIIDSIKPQIRYVDSLAASIKTSQLDSLFRLIKERESEQKKLLRKINNIISSSKELENKYIEIMPENSPYRVNNTIQKGYSILGTHNYFDIVVPKIFNVGNAKRIIVIKLNIPSSSVNHISIKFAKGNMSLGELRYLPKESYNKLIFQRNLTNNTKIDVGIFLKSEWNTEYPRFYYRNILVKK
jgi:hypothetical protein